MNPTDPSVSPTPHRPHHQQHQHMIQTRKPMAVPTPQPSMNTLVSTPEVPSTPAQQEILQELLSAFDNLGTSQHIDYH